MNDYTFWLIFYEDPDLPVEVFTDQESAEKRFEQISDNWNATLFKQVRRNYRLEREH